MVRNNFNVISTHHSIDHPMLGHILLPGRPIRTSRTGHRRIPLVVYNCNFCIKSVNLTVFNHVSISRHDLGLIRNIRAYPYLQIYNDSAIRTLSRANVIEIGISYLDNVSSRERSYCGIIEFGCTEGCETHLNRLRIKI